MLPSTDPNVDLDDVETIRLIKTQGVLSGASPMEDQMLTCYLISRTTVSGAYTHKYTPDADSATGLHSAIEAYFASQMTTGLFDHGNKVCGHFNVSY